MSQARFQSAVTVVVLILLIPETGFSGGGREPGAVSTQASSSDIPKARRAAERKRQNEMNPFGANEQERNSALANAGPVSGAGVDNAASAWSAVEHSGDSIEVASKITNVGGTVLGNAASQFTGLITMVGGFLYEVAIDEDSRAGAQTLMQMDRENQEFEETGSTDSVQYRAYGQTEASLEALYQELGI